MTDAPAPTRLVSATRPAAAVLAALLVVATPAGFGHGPAARPGAKVWHDHATGLAIAGYDPLSYFDHEGPRLGEAHLELEHAGAVWRFVNSGNRAAFERHPEVYEPRFGGYDPVALANGRTTAGLPSIWAVHEGRVYLFHTPLNRRLWRRDPARVTAQSQKNWRSLAGGIASPPGW